MISDVTNAIKECAVLSGDIIKNSVDDIDIDFKSTNNLVTKTDKDVETFIKSYLGERFSGISFLGEEFSSSENLDSERLWIVDPLDGTNNFAEGIPHYAVSIAYAEHGVVQSGVIYDPCRDELFYAEKDKGSFLNERRIFASDKESLNEIIVATGFYYDRGIIMEATLSSIKLLFQKNIRGIRRMGSAALDLAWVACGRYDAYFEYKLGPWDYAAGLLISKEAGADCFSTDGLEASVLAGNIATCCKKISDEFMATIRLS